jgi:hypothetical protein
MFKASKLDDNELPTAIPAVSMLPFEGTLFGVPASKG